MPVFDFPRFRSGHGIRPRDWLPSLTWHNASALADFPPDAQAIYVRNLPGGAIGHLPTGVEALRLGWCPALDDDALAGLAGLTRLRWLFIDHPVHPRFSPGALAVLRGLPALRALALRARPEEDRTPVLTSAHLAALEGLPLSALALGNHAALHDVSALRTLPGLRTLDLTGSDVRAGLPPQIEALHLDGKQPLSEECTDAIGQMTALRALSLCQRTGDRAWTLPRLETAYLFGARGLSVSGERLARLDLGETRLPSPEALAAHTGLRAIRLPGHRLTGAHLAALPGVAHLWIEGGAPKLQPGDWAALRGCQRLTLACGLKLRPAHLEAIAALPLETLHILRGAERIAAGSLGGLSGARWIHLEGCRDTTPLHAALPAARITTEPTARVSG